MQLAFITLFLIFILFPGVSFRLGYLKRDGLLIVSGTKLYIEFIIVVILSIILHFFSWFWAEVIGYDFQVDLFYKLITAAEINDLEDNEYGIARFVSYNIGLSIFVFLIGWYLNHYLTKNRKTFPENFQFLDYTGYWDRILSDNTEISLRSKVNTIIDALVEINEKAYIYTGVLDRYYVDSKGFIDKLILNDVTRMSMEKYDSLQTSLQNGKGVSSMLGHEESEDGKETSIPVKKDSNTDQKSIPSIEQEVQELTKDDIIKDKDLQNLVRQVSTTSEDFYTSTVQIPNHHFVVYGSTIKNIGVRYKVITGQNSNSKRVIKSINPFRFFGWIYRIKVFGNRRFLPYQQLRKFKRKSQKVHKFKVRSYDFKIHRDKYRKEKEK